MLGTKILSLTAVLGVPNKEVFMKEVQPNIVKGSQYALVGFFCMAVFGILTKQALQSGSFIWVSFIAYLSATVVLLPYVVAQGFQYLKSEHYTYLLGRALFGTLASFLYTISIQYIPLVNGTLLFNTAPIFIPLLAITFLKMHLEKGTWLAVAVGFIGIIVLIKPTLAIFTQAGNLIALASGVSLAIAYLLMKVLTNSEPGVRIIFYSLGIGTLVQIPLLFFSESAPGGESILFAVLSGVILAAAQLALVTSYRYAEAWQVGVYQYSSVVFVGLLDWLLWNNVPTLRDIVGIMLVTIAGIIIIRSSNNKMKAG